MNKDKLNKPCKDCRKEKKNEIKHSGKILSKKNRKQSK